MPWKRFQDIVDSIESKLLSIKDVAQYVGLIEGHTTMMVSQQTLALLQQNVEKNQETKELVEEMCLRLDAMSLKFSKAEGVRQTANSLAKLAEERLSEPTMADVDSSVAPDSDIGQSLLTPSVQIGLPSMHSDRLVFHGEGRRPRLLAKHIIPRATGFQREGDPSTTGE